MAAQIFSMLLGIDGAPSSTRLMASIRCLQRVFQQKVKMQRIAYSIVAAAILVSNSKTVFATDIAGIEYGSSGVVLQTATLAESVANAIGEQQQGYGYISTINGQPNYCAGGGNCGLFYHFFGYQVATNNPFLGKIEFTGGTVRIYYSANARSINLFGQDSLANIAIIQNMTPYVQLFAHKFYDPLFGGTASGYTVAGTVSLTGQTSSVFGASLVDVDTSGSFGTAAAAAFFNGNLISDNLGAFADLAITTSSNSAVLNPFDASGSLADSCASGAAQTGDWCLQGTLSARGGVVAVPEPAALHLVLVGALGLAAAVARRRNAGRSTAHSIRDVCDFSA